MVSNFWGCVAMMLYANVLGVGLWAGLHFRREEIDHKKMVFQVKLVRHPRQRSYLSHKVYNKHDNKGGNIVR